MDANVRHAGYSYILRKLTIDGIPNWHTSFVATTGSARTKIQKNFVEEIFTAQYWPGNEIVNHLEFAMKYDGVNLALLKQIFDHLPEDEMTHYIQSKPTGKYARRLWFFYEFLTGRLLPLNDATSGNYVDILERKKYYTIKRGKKSQRHRINNNLLGPKEFCPIIRKTEKLSGIDSHILREKCEKIITSYSPAILRRALTYLYGKETKSSFEIEQIKPNSSRIEKFIALLSLAEKEDFCKKEQLVELQNRIVDSRFKDDDYRTSQNYVGQTLPNRKELIHFITPKPNDLPKMMEGLIASHNWMMAGDVSPIVHAAAISYGFVFLHPFEDGNGRIHRFLIHNILSMLGVVPRGLMFPVSAVMVKNLIDYDLSLESFSRPLLQHIDFSMDTLGKMTVKNETAIWYYYMDLTIQTESLYSFVNKTIEEELINELDFLVYYDVAYKAIQEVIDMPDQLINLFIRLCLQNSGTLSAKKRGSHFDFLTDNELLAMEVAVRDAYLPVS